MSCCSRKALGDILLTPLFIQMRKLRQNMTFPGQRFFSCHNRLCPGEQDWESRAKQQGSELVGKREPLKAAEQGRDPVEIKK